MHDYFKKMVEVRIARSEFRSSIERIANESNIDINIKIYADSPIVTVWDKSVTAVIRETSVHAVDDIPLDKDWSRFIDKLRQLVEHG